MIRFYDTSSIKSRIVLPFGSRIAGFVVILLASASVAFAQIDETELKEKARDLRTGKLEVAPATQLIEILLTQGHVQAAGWWIETLEAAQARDEFTTKEGRAIGKLRRKWTKAVRPKGKVRALGLKLVKHADLLARKKNPTTARTFLDHTDTFLRFLPEASIGKALARARGKIDPHGKDESPKDLERAKKSGDRLIADFATALDEVFGDGVIEYETFGAGPGFVRLAALSKTIDALKNTDEHDARVDKLKTISREQEIKATRKLQVWMRGVRSVDVHSDSADDGDKPTRVPGEAETRADDDLEMSKWTPYSLDVFPGDTVLHILTGTTRRGRGADMTVLGIYATLDGQPIPVARWAVAKGSKPEDVDLKKLYPVMLGRRRKLSRSSDDEDVDIPDDIERPKYTLRYPAKKSRSGSTIRTPPRMSAAWFEQLGLRAKWLASYRDDPVFVLFVPDGTEPKKE